MPGFVFGVEVFVGLDFLSVEVESDSAFFCSGEDGDVFLAIVDFFAAFNSAFPTDIVGELAASEEEGFASGLPLAGGGSDGGEGAVFGGGFKSGHQGEGLVHGEVFARERFEGDVSPGDEGVGNLDALDGGISGSGKVDEGGGIGEVFEGEAGGGLITGGKLDGVSAKTESEAFSGSVVQKEAEVGRGVSVVQ